MTMFTKTCSAPLLQCLCFVFTESLIDSALSTGVIEILKDYLVKFRTDEDVILMVLLAVGSLADSGNLLPDF